MLIRIGQRPDHGFNEPIGLLSDCHRRIEHFLRVLVVLDEQAGGGPMTAVQRDQLEGALAYFATAAPRHTADEEDSLFPRLRCSNDPAARSALEVIARLEDDHERADHHHREVDTLGRRWLADGQLPPADARELRERLAALQDLYARHIAVEDTELFPAADRLLSADQIRDIGREMAARRRGGP
jgi:hemerythrin-like domain-containing protein